MITNAAPIIAPKVTTLLPVGGSVGTGVEVAVVPGA